MEYDIKRTYHANDAVAIERYYLMNRIHRTDGPASIWYYNNGSIRSEYYYLMNQRHRTNAPAVTYYNENGTIEREVYFKNDIDITHELREAHYDEADEYTKALIWSML